MKNLKLLSILFILLSNTIYSQKNSIKINSLPDSLIILKKFDDMAGQTYYYASYNLECFEENEGFYFFGYIGKTLHYDFIHLKTYGLGDCNEKNELIIMFEDDSKIVMRSVDNFNCKGSSMYVLTGSGKKKLSKLRIKKIRYTNGRSYKSLTYELNSDYFIKLMRMVKNKQTFELN